MKPSVARLLSALGAFVVPTHPDPSGGAFDGDWSDRPVFFLVGTTEAGIKLTTTELRLAFEGWCATVSRMTVHRRRRALHAALTSWCHQQGRPTPEALWPRFWMIQGRWRHLGQAGVTLHNALPVAVHRAGPTGPWWPVLEWMVGALRWYTTIRRPSTMRKAVTFLYGFLGDLPWTPPASGSGESWMVSLRQQGLGSCPGEDPRRRIWRAYVSYRQRRRAASPPRRLVGLSTVRHQLHWLSVVFHHALRWTARPLLVPRRAYRSSGGTHRRHREPGGRAGPLGVVLIEEAVVVPPEDEVEVGVALLDCCGPWRPPGPDPGRVHTFGADEIERLHRACTTLFERLLMLTLFTPR